MNILIGFLTALHLLVALFMIVLVLMQKSKDQGVGAAFGGGVTDTVFGAGTTTALVRMTIWCACIFLAGSLILTVLHSRRNASSGTSLMQKALETAPAAPASTVPALPMPETTPSEPAATTPAPAPPTTENVPAATVPAEPPVDNPQP
jgi:preprotein translocase subunit SecG